MPFFMWYLKLEERARDTKSFFFLQSQNLLEGLRTILLDCPRNNLQEKLPSLSKTVRQAFPACCSGRQMTSFILTPFIQWKLSTRKGHCYGCYCSRMLCKSGPKIMLKDCSTLRIRSDKLLHLEWPNCYFQRGKSWIIVGFTDHWMVQFHAVCFPQHSTQSLSLPLWFPVWRRCLPWLSGRSRTACWRGLKNRDATLRHPALTSL